MAGSSITVLLAAEMGLLRHALTRLLGGQADIDVVEAMADVGAVAREARRLRPDIVVVDLDPPAARTLAALRDLHAQLPSTPIIALVTVRPTSLLRELISSPPLAEALAVVDKNDSAVRLVEAVRAAAQGELVVDASVALAALASAPGPLSRREREVLRLAAGGATNQEISVRLHLAPGTVRNYLSGAITKTGARNRIDAARIARKSGWL